MRCRVKKQWISRPVITVREYMASCRPITLMSFSCKISPPTKKTIATGEYLWDSAEAAYISKTGAFWYCVVKQGQYVMIYIFMQKLLVLTRWLCWSDGWPLYSSSLQSPSQVFPHSPYSPGWGQRQWRGPINPKYWFRLRCLTSELCHLLGSEKCCYRSW